MKFRSIAFPAPSAGVKIKGPSLVVPNQSMSLQEILTRFTRHEELPVYHEGAYDEDGDEDLEKLANADLVDKEEYAAKLEEVKQKYDRQEKAKAKKAHEKAVAEARKQIEDEVRKQTQPQKPGENPG